MIIQTIGKSSNTIEIVDEISCVSIRKMEMSVQVYNMIDDVIDTALTQFKSPKYRRNKLKFLYSEHEGLSSLVLSYELSQNEKKLDKDSLRDLAGMVHTIHNDIVSTLSNLIRIHHGLKDLFGSTLTIIDKHESYTKPVIGSQQKTNVSKSVSEDIQDVFEDWELHSHAMF